MWKVFLAYATHRIFMFIVALVASYTAVSKNVDSVGGATWERFKTRTYLVTYAPQYAQGIQKSWGELFRSTPRPFTWCHKLLVDNLGFGNELALVLLSNIFAFLFFWEVYLILLKFGSEQVAMRASVLGILIPFGFLMSLISGFGFTCYLLALTVHWSLDHRWWLSGIGLAFLSLTEPFAILFIPLLLFIFVYFQRHFYMVQVIKRGLFMFLPVVGVLVWKVFVEGESLGIFPMVRSSAVFNIVGAVIDGKGMGWMFGTGVQRTTAVFFLILVSGGMGFWGATDAIGRVLPAYFALVLALSVPFGALGVSAPMAAVSFEGFARMVGGVIFRATAIFLIGLGMIEVALIYK